MTTHYAGAEKRNYLRFKWQAPVQLILGETTVIGEIHNISLGGILVSSDLKMKYNDEIVAQFSVPKLPNPVVAQCKVRWISADKEGGLNFMGLKAIETWAISQLLRQLQDEQGK